MNRPTFYIAITFALFVTAFSGELRTVDGASGKTLFTLIEPATARSGESRSSLASVREALIAIDPTAMRGVGSSTIRLPLLDGKTYLAKQLTSEGLETRSLDDITWRGKIIDGEFAGDVVITSRKGLIAGLIYSPNSVYEIIAKGDRQILVELDQDLFPPCAGGVTGDTAKSAVPGKALAGVDSGDRIDVLVLYTAAVRTSAGGDAQAAVLAQQAIDATNTSYINSKIRQRVRLVGAQFTTMVETGDFSTELSNLRANADAATAREATKADLVDMLTNSTAACGIGYLMGAVGGNPNNGFTVTSRTCAVGNLSFAHELGHNMASHHNPENGGTPTFPYAFGHYVNGSYRTVMSYVDPCTSGCTRVAYFSNPNIIYNGQPTGIDNARDNARSINNTADWIASYRYSGSSITMTGFNGGEMLQRNIARNVTWTSDNLSGNVRIELSRDETTNWETLVANTPNDGAEQIVLSGRAARRARIRVISVDNAAVSDSSVSNVYIR